MIKIADIEALLKSEKQSTHIYYGIPLVNLKEIINVTGGTLDQDMYGVKHSLVIENTCVRIVLHSLNRNQI